MLLFPIHLSVSWILRSYKCSYFIIKISNFRGDLTNPSEVSAITKTPVVHCQRSRQLPHGYLPEWHPVTHSSGLSPPICWLSPEGSRPQWLDSDRWLWERRRFTGAPGVEHLDGGWRGIHTGGMLGAHQQSEGVLTSKHRYMLKCVHQWSCFQNLIIYLLDYLIL